jgi:uncharacterized protein YggE
MKKALSVMGFIAALLVVALARPADPAAGAIAPLSQPDKTGSLHTSGTAVIRVQPDRATIRFGVQTFARTPRASQAENVAVVKWVLRALEEQGIAGQDIGTDSFTVRPEYDYRQYGERALVGYWSDNGVLVNLRDVSQLSDVLVAALEAGATTVDDLTFGTTRLRELRDQARELAVKAALEKADALAEAANATAGSVTDIQENSWSYYYGSGSRGQASNQAQNVMQEIAPASAPAIEDSEFSLGQIIVQAQVDVSVELR